jgi:hypothetical protein
MTQLRHCNCASPTRNKAFDRASLTKKFPVTTAPTKNCQGPPEGLENPTQPKNGASPSRKKNINNWLMQRAQQNFPPPAAQTKNGETQTTNPHKPKKKKHFTAATQTKSHESQTNNCASQKKSQIKKIAARAQQNIFPVATAQTKTTC